MARTITLPAKLVRPTQKGAYRRARLFAVLDRARPVAWVSGPPGAGKTTLVASYVEARRLRALWYQFDEGDSDVATVFYYLRLAAQRLSPRKRWRLPLLTPEYLPGLDTFARRWFEELFAGAPRPFCVVFDNYHEVAADSPTHGVVRCAIECLPPGGRAVFASRADPPSAMARLRVAGTIALVDWDALRLTPRETAAIARSRSGGRLSPEQARSLQTASDGWAAGVVLMLEHALGETRAALQSGRQALFDYFAAEILRHTDVETRRILLETAVLPKVTRKQAQALTGTVHASQVLAELARRRYFTDAYDDPEPTYQYHPLFHQFLRARATEQLPAERRHELHGRAVSLLEQDGQIEHAAELLLEAQDGRGLARIVLANAATYVATGRASTLSSWLAAIPAEIIQATPWLQYWRAASRLAFSTDAAVEHAGLAYEGFLTQGDHAGLMAAACLAADAIMYDWGNFTRLDRWILALEQLLRPGAPTVPPPLQAQAIASLFGSLLWRKPDHPEMSAWAERAEACFHHAADSDYRSRVGLSVGWYFLYIGDFAKAEVILEELNVATAAAATSPLARLWAMGLEMQLGWLKSDSRRCLETFSRAQALVDASGVRILDTLFVISRTFGCLIARDLDRARESLEELRRGVPPTQVARLTEYHYLASWLAILSGDVPTAHAHAVAGEATATQAGMYFVIVITRLALAQTLFERGDRILARNHLLDALTMARAMATRHLEYQCMLVDADFALRDGDEVSCEASLRIAFDLGRRHGFLAGGWWRPDLVARLCTRALASGIEPEYARLLVRVHHLVPDPSVPAPEQWPWPIRIRAFGAFEIEIDSRRVAFAGKAQRKPLALLKAVVAFGGRGVREQDIADALWPDAEGDAAHQALAVTLHRLRRLLRDAAAIHRQEGRLELDAQRVWSDVAALDATLQRARHTAPDVRAGLVDEALQLYRGPLLAGDEDEPWSTAPRDRFRARLVRELQEVARAFESSGDADRAASLYLKALDVDDLAEDVYRRLIALHERLGRRAEALAVYARCEATLRAALGVKPSRETEAMVRALGASS